MFGVLEYVILLEKLVKCLSEFVEVEVKVSDLDLFLFVVLVRVLVGVFVNIFDVICDVIFVFFVICYLEVLIVFVGCSWMSLENSGCV